LGFLACKTVSQITYTVLVETLNPAHSLIPYRTCLSKLNSFKWPADQNTMDREFFPLMLYTFEENCQNVLQGTLCIEMGNYAAHKFTEIKCCKDAFAHSIFQCMKAC